MCFQTKIIMFTIFAGVFLFSLVFPPTVMASTTTLGENIKSITQLFGDAIGLSDTDPRIIITRLIHILLGFIGIILLIMILLSGVQFMFSGGNDEKVKKAKKTFYGAIIGLIIILSAY